MSLTQPACRIESARLINFVFQGSTHQLPELNVLDRSIHSDLPASSNSAHELSTGGVVKITVCRGNADQMNFPK